MDRQYSQVGIIGGGELGQALGGALGAARAQVLFYDKNPTRTTSGSIEDIVRSCPLLLLCVPSWEVKNVFKQMAKAAHPHERRVVIGYSKGVESGFATMDAVFASHLPEHYDYGLMYGPLLASEIKQGRPAYGAVALSNNALFQPLRQSFAAGGIVLEATTDMHGVALCGALKNIYAIAFGVCDGLRLGINTKARLAVVALGEVKRLLRDMNADPRTAEGIAGLGDILATGFSDTSFNYRIGKTLAEGIASEHVKSEGLVTLNELAHKVKIANYPVAAAINQIAFHYGQPQKLQAALE